MRGIPRNVRVVTVLGWVAGILNILGGLFLALLAGASTDGLVKGTVLLLGALGVAFGLAFVFVTGGLPAASRGARIGVTVIAGITMVPAVLSTVLGLSVSGAVTALLAALVIVLLWAGPARKHFRRPELRAPSVGAIPAPGPQSDR